MFVRLRISSLRIKLAASNFARHFIGVQGRESHILGNFTSPEAPPEAKNGTNRPILCSLATTRLAHPTEVGPQANAQVEFDDERKIVKITISD